MEFCKAVSQDLPFIAGIYDEIHTQEEAGNATVGWVRGVYPTLETAAQALNRDDLFVLKADGQIVGAAVINQCQVDVYRDAPWDCRPDDAQVMVLHTLVISPKAAGNGFGRAFVRFYEEYALAHGCPYLRMDTNARNLRARAFYSGLGYREIGIVPCNFNGIDGVQLVLLEKELIS